MPATLTDVPAKSTGVATAPIVSGDHAIPALTNGDRLTRDEFERRCAAMPADVKAELVDGRVYIVPSPVSHKNHSGPHVRASHWIASYMEFTTGVDAGDNATLRLDLDNEPQPDLFLRIQPECGGQSTDDGDYVGGAPELIFEIAGSTVAYDLYEKLDAYRRNGVREYIVWTTRENELRWFILRESRYDLLAPGEDVLYRSETFPGLWLNAQALLTGDLKGVRAAVEQGVATAEHGEFVRRLTAK